MVPLDEVPVFAPELPAAYALAELAGSRLRRGLVVENGRLEGILSIVDLMRAIELGWPRPSG
jgi:CBS domain-containing protein